MNDVSMETEGRVGGDVGFEPLFRGAAAALALMTPDGTWLRVNPALCALLGYAPADLEGIESRHFVHPVDLNTYLDYLQGHSMGEPIGSSVEVRLQHREGHSLWARLSFSKVSSAAAEPDCLVVTIENIHAAHGAKRLAQSTEVQALEEQRQTRLAVLNLMEDAIASRRKAEEANDALRKLSRAVEQSPDSIVITDLDGAIEYVNDAFVKVTGYTREECLGRNPRILKSGKTPPETYAAMWSTLRQGQSWKGEFRNCRKDGGEYVEFAVIAPIREPDGRVTHYVAVKEDISEKKRIGQELDRYRQHLEELVETRTAELAQAKAAAESANVAKTAFLANMSHEIRTPLNAIVGLTSLMRRDDVSHRQLARLQKIDAAGAHLLTIINNVLDLSKIEAGRMDLEQLDFPVKEVMEKVEAILHESALAKGLRLLLDTDHLPVWLHGDPTRLRQALLNYASNAVKFTQQGSIALRARLLAEDEKGYDIRFEVEDTGIGLDADQVERLFKSFEQADASITRKFGGTGLGLTLTRHLAKLMGGDSGVTSTPGAGSTFWFTARLGRCQQDASVLAAKAESVDNEAELRKHAGARILIADDNNINADIARELLEAVGLSVAVASNGMTAVEAAMAESFALILMDVQMPEMDGLEATRRIRALTSPRANVPIIAMTANALAEDRQACFDAGMNDFVSKPVDPQYLYLVLLRHLGVPPAPPDRGVPPAKVSGGDTPATAPAQASLPPLPGFDTQAGLASVRGKVDFYLMLLDEYASHNADVVSRFHQARAEGNSQTAKRTIHTLKGVSGTLGIMSVHRKANELDAALKENQPAEIIDALAKELEQLQSAALTTIRHARPAGGAG